MPRASTETPIPDPERERAYAHSLRGVFASPAEHEDYLRAGWLRAQIVLALVEELGPAALRRCLELGANPYLMTVLLRRRFGFELELANHFGNKLDPEVVRSQTAELDGQPVEFRYRDFDIQSDRFPYADASFDLVLFCEILEHLLVEPTHVMREIRRVLRPGGSLVVSTPNATRLTNAYHLALGVNVYDGYSPNGALGRHNREFTLPELQTLLDGHGFVVTRARVSNIQRLARRFTWLQWMRPNVWNEHLFVVAQRPAA